MGEMINLTLFKMNYFIILACSQIQSTNKLVMKKVFSLFKFREIVWYIKN
jgi:hypothetical protein